MIQIIDVMFFELSISTLIILIRCDIETGCVVSQSIILELLVAQRTQINSVQLFTIRRVNGIVRTCNCSIVVIKLRDEIILTKETLICNRQSVVFYRIRLGGFRIIM